MNQHNALATRQSTGLLPDPETWKTMMNMADALFRSGLLPDAIKTTQAAVAIIQKGTELGIPPMAALTSIVVIKGKPTANAELMLALIYRDHGDGAIVFAETTDALCKIRYQRRSWSMGQSYTFTMADAQKASLLGNDTWRKYPAAMLRARCISAVARMAFPDSIGGMYCPEELGAEVDVVDGEVVIVEQRQRETVPARSIASNLPDVQVDVETGEIVDDEPERSIVDVLSDEMDMPDFAEVERTEILNELPNLSDKRDLAGVRERISNANLDDDRDVERAYKLAYRRLHNERPDPSENDAQQPLGVA